MDSSIVPVLQGFFLLYRGEVISLSDCVHYCELFGVWDVARFVTLLKIAEYVMLKESK